MHVLILPSWYPRFKDDVEGSFFRDQAHGLAEAGLKAGVVFPDLRGPRRFFRKNRPSGIVVAQDGPVAEVRSHGFNWFLGNMTGFEWLWLRHADKALAVYFEKFGKPDIVHAHSMEPAASAAIRLYARYGIPFVITEHSSTHILGLTGEAAKEKCAGLARASSANLAVSEVFAGKLNEQYGGDWHYLPNIVAPRFLCHPLTSREKGDFRLVSVARLNKGKRMDLVIDAVADLRKRGFAVALTIVGDGDERLSLEQKVAALGLEDKVEFSGHVTTSDMPAMMAKGQLLVSASEFETFGVTLIEGMALGMPIVATRSGGPESIITPAVGKLVDHWNGGAIADAIEAVISDIDHYDPADIREHCKARYSAPVISEALKSIYTDVVSYAG